MNQNETPLRDIATFVITAALMAAALAVAVCL